MPVIKVPDLGKIVVSSAQPDDLYYGEDTRRRWYLVRLVDQEGGEVYGVMVGQPLSPGGNPFRLYNTVHAALSFFLDEKGERFQDIDKEGWLEAQIPYGKIIVEWRSLAGKERKRGIAISRSYGEDASHCARMALTSKRFPASAGWEDEGTVAVSQDKCLWTVTNRGWNDFTITWSGEICHEMAAVENEWRTCPI